MILEKDMHPFNWMASFLPLLIFIITGVLVTGATAASLNRPTRLLTDGNHNPMAVDSNSIFFTWMMNAGKRGSMQTAYQIVVASSMADIDMNHGDMWNSGRVGSSQSAGVVYDGKAVSAATRYWWKVRVWDNHREISRWSKAAIFGVGLSKSDWTAKYIWDGTTNLNNFAYFRQTFVIKKRPRLGKVYVSAHNDYILYLNGHLLGRGPARSNPYLYGQYNAYDITKIVRAGKNVFAAIAYWQGTWNNAGVNARPAFMLEACLSYPDGSSTALGTDSSWKTVASTPFVESDATYFPPMRSRAAPATGAYRWTNPETGSDTLPRFVRAKTTHTGGDRAAIRFDSRRGPTGWKDIGFDDSKWSHATVVDRSNFDLYAQRAPLERVQAELKPVSIMHTDNAWFVDFRQCIDGWPKLTMHENRPGDTIRVQYFEMNGEKNPAGWDEYICHGGRETWDADFGRHTSFQELRISGYAGRLRPSDVRGVLAYCDVDVAGCFHCSSPLVDSIYQMCVRSAQQNIQEGIISVDANREQASWLADSWNIGSVLLYNDRNTMMIDKVVRDYGEAQLPNGDFPACAPAQRFRQIPEWSMYWPMLLWEQYLFSGDTTLLHTMAPRLARFLEWIRTYQDSRTKLLDPPGWRISDYAGGDMPSGGYNVATVCQYYENLRIASRMFSVLGNMSRSKKYLRQAEEVTAGINSSLFNGRYYIARTDRKKMFQLASAWPLRFNIKPGIDKARILAAIRKAGKPDIGGYGGDALYAGMLNSGDGAYVVKDLVRYRPMLDGNDANWESFDPGRGEVNHAWTAYPGYLLQKYFGGIWPTSGGFATFDVKPVTSGLAFVDATVPTVKGLITTSWKKTSDGRFTLSVNVPANTHATVYIPKLTSGNVTITESGRQIWPQKSGVKDPGVIRVSDDGASVKCLVGSGNYRFIEAP